MVVDLEQPSDDLPTVAVRSDDLDTKPDPKPKTVKRPPANKMVGSPGFGGYATKG